MPYQVREEGNVAESQVIARPGASPVCHRIEPFSTVFPTEANRGAAPSDMRSFGHCYGGRTTAPPVKGGQPDAGQTVDIRFAMVLRQRAAPQDCHAGMGD